MPQIKDSLYEQLYPLTTIAGQRFVDDFSGDAVDVKRWGFGGWVVADGVGNSAVMSDEINGGLLLTTSGTGTNSGLTMSFLAGTNTTGEDNMSVIAIPVRQFASGLCNMIFTMRMNMAVGNVTNVGGGFSETSRPDMAGDNMALLRGANGQTEFQLRTSNSGGSQNDTNTDVAFDNNWHTYKILSNFTADPTPAGTGVTLFIDGVLKATNTSAIGYFNENVAPLFCINRNSTTSISANIGYCEAWNEV